MSATHPLNTSQPDHLTYSSGLVDIAVLGGVRTDILDRMRVTLKISIAHHALRHNLDLYNSHQTEKLVRLVAERMETGTSVVSAALDELTNHLESWRLTQREKEHQTEDKRKILSEQEIKQARNYLSSPNLMERTKEDIGKSGVTGEENNRLLMYLVFTSRKRDNPLHIISLGSSGIGKTHLQEKVSALIPGEDKLEITTLSENAFYYFGQQQLRHKLILIEDLDGAENVLYPLREIKSKKRITKTVVIKNTKGETRTVNLVVEGPVSISGCTTRESLYEDNANRSFLIYIDESPEQDERVMNYQRKQSAGKTDHKAEEQLREQFRDMQRILLPIPVRNPYAEQLKIPVEVLKPRRTNAHYLAFIEVVTWYHQYQRTPKTDPVTGETYLETTIEDIGEANKLMKDILLHKSDELTGACRSYFERLKTWLKEKAPDENGLFSNREARHALRENPSNQKRYMQQLQQNGHIRKTTGDQKKGYYYQVTDYEDYQTLKQGIENILGNIVATLEKQTGSPKAVHSPNEPLNPKTTNKIQPQRTENGKQGTQGKK